MRILDLFCCDGGASMGYHRAFPDAEIYGVDIEDRPNYPFQFSQMDAMKLLTCVDFLGSYFDFIHASPPCQAASTLTVGTNKGKFDHPQLIPDVRAALDEVGLPYVIENVNGAELRRDVVLCGEMFGLGVIRHRVFELGGWTCDQPKHVPHRGRVRGWRHGVYHDGPYLAVYGKGGDKGTVAERQQAMDIDWTDDYHALGEAIPPAYSEWIGRQFAASRQALPAAA